MVIDTGATRTLLAKSLAKRAGIEPSSSLGSIVSTANGKIWQAGGRAKQITLGDASSSYVPVFIQTTDDNIFGNTDVEGLLGLSFLGNFKFSLNKGILELQPLE
ncbi:MAG: retroviral-like aspartic protease family protein [Rickettsiales bacterium]|nr:retroviral-like aspartic protease family protein [Rickettsiales bacterium]